MSEKKKTMRAVIEIIIAVLVIIAVYFIIRGMDRHDVRIQQAATENETQRVWKEFQEKTVSIKLHKKTWKFAHPVQTYLFIGTDKSGNEDAEGEEYHGSMADALMLVVVDEEEKSIWDFAAEPGHHHRSANASARRKCQCQCTDAALYGTLVWKGQGCKL